MHKYIHNYVYDWFKSEWGHNNQQNKPIVQYSVMFTYILLKTHQRVLTSTKRNILHSALWNSPPFMLLIYNVPKLYILTEKHGVIHSPHI